MEMIRNNRIERRRLDLGGGGFWRCGGGEEGCLLFVPSENFEILVKILHSGGFWEYLLSCLKEIFCDMLSYSII